MKVSRVEVTNIRGIESVAIEPGVLTVISGENGSGKTSVIESIKAVFSGGYDGTLVRKGQKRGEVKITLDDGHILKRVINVEKGTSNLEIKSATGELVPSPQKFVESLAQGFAFDPLAFLAAPAKKRAAYIEQFINVIVTADELKEAVRADWWNDVYNPRESAFSNIARVKKVAYDRRTDLNRRVRDLEGTIRQLKDGVPTLNTEGVDWEAAAKAKHEELNRVTKVHAVAIAEAKEKAKAATDAAEAENRFAHSKIDADYQRKLAELNAWKSEEVGRIDGHRAEKLAAIVAEENSQLRRIGEENLPLIDKARSEWEAAERDLADWNRATGAREVIKKKELELRNEQQGATSLGMVIDRLDKLRLAKLELVPIPGLEMVDGDVFIDGLPFDALNTQKRIGTALRIAAEGAGELKLMIVDDMEHFDKANWNEFVEAVKESNFQLVVGKVVEEGPLKVEVV